MAEQKTRPINPCAANRVSRRRATPCERFPPRNRGGRRLIQGTYSNSCTTVVLFYKRIGSNGLREIPQMPHLRRHGHARKLQGPPRDPLPRLRQTVRPALQERKHRAIGERLRQGLRRDAPGISVRRRRAQRVRQRLVAPLYYSIVRDCERGRGRRPRRPGAGRQSTGARLPAHLRVVWEPRDVRRLRGRDPVPDLGAAAQDRHGHHQQRGRALRRRYITDAGPLGPFGFYGLRARRER